MNPHTREANTVKTIFDGEDSGRVFLGINTDMLAKNNTAITTIAVCMCVRREAVKYSVLLSNAVNIETVKSIMQITVRMIALK